MLKNTQYDFTEHDKPVFMTMGEFVQLLVDNRDEAVCLRSVQSGALDAQGNFAQEVRVVLLPAGHVVEEVKKYETFRMSKLLTGLTQKGVVK